MYVVLHIVGWDAHVFGKGAGVDVGLGELFAHRIVASATVVARHAGHVMMDKDPISRFELGYPPADLCHNAGRLVSQHNGGLVNQVPFHRIAATEPARVDLNLEFARPDHRIGGILQPYITVVIVNGDLQSGFLRPARARRPLCRFGLPSSFSNHLPDPSGRPGG